MVPGITSEKISDFPGQLGQGTLFSIIPADDLFFFIQLIMLNALGKGIDLGESALTAAQNIPTVDVITNLPLLMIADRAGGRVRRIYRFH